MTVTDRDPTDLLVGLDAPLPPGAGPDLDAVVAGGRRRRRRRVTAVIGAVCLVAGLGVGGASWLPEASRAPVPSSGLDVAPGPDDAPTMGRGIWTPAGEQGDLGPLAQQQIDEVLAQAGAEGVSGAASVRWAEALDTAPLVHDGVSLVAPLSTGGDLGYTIDQDPTGGEGEFFVDEDITDAWRTDEVFQERGSSGSTRAADGALGAVAREGDTVASSVTPSEHYEAPDPPSDVVVRVFRGGVLYAVGWTAPVGGTAPAPDEAVLREAVYRIADAASDGGLVTAADPDLRDWNAPLPPAEAAAQADYSSWAFGRSVASIQQVAAMIGDALAAADGGGEVVWGARVPGTEEGTGFGTGFGAWPSEDGTREAGVDATDSGTWGESGSQVTFYLRGTLASGWSGEDACDMAVLDEGPVGACRSVAPTGDEEGVALLTSDRVGESEQGLPLASRVVASRQGGQVVMVEVRGTRPALSEDQLLALTHDIQVHLAGANAEWAPGWPG